MNNFILLGDSVMKGVMYSSELNKYKLCKNNSYSFLNSDTLCIKNKSKMGATINYCYETLTSHSDIFSNSTIIFEFGGNDCDYNWANISNDSTSNLHSPHVEPDEFISTYKKCIEYTRSIGSNVVISNLVPIDADKYINWISRNLNYDNILSWLGDASSLYRWQEYYNNLVEKLAIECNCNFIDVRSIFLKSHDFKNLICSDGIHPTATGHTLLHNCISQYILSLN